MQCSLNTSDTIHQNEKQSEHIGSGAHHNKITIGAGNRACHLLSKDYWGKKELRGFLKALPGQFYGRGVSKEIPWKMGKILIMKKGRPRKKKIKGKQKDAFPL